MRPIWPIALLVLVAINHCSADRGVEISMHVSPGQWPMYYQSNSIPNNEFWVSSTSNPTTYYPGIYAAMTNGSYTFLQTDMGFYRTSVDSISTVPTLASSGLTWASSNLPSKTEWGGFSYSGPINDRGYLFRTQQLIAFSVGAYTNPSAKMALFTGDGTDNPLGGGQVIMDVWASDYPTRPYVNVLLTSISPQVTSSWFRHAYDSGNKFTWSGTQSTLSLQTRCFRVFYDSDSRKVLTTCSGLLLTSTVNAQAGQEYVYTPGTVAYPLGAGDLVTGVYRQMQKRLYAGSSLGLAFEMDTTTFTLLRVTLIISGSSLSPFRSVVLDEPPGSPGVLFWGTTDGIVARVNIRDFEIFATTSMGRGDDMGALYTGNTPGFVFAAGGPNSTTTNPPTNTFQNWKISKFDCSVYTCATCLANPTDQDYCGWCTGSGSCTTSATCSSGWTQTVGICPAGVSLTPSRGSTNGGTTVVYTGTYFIATEPQNYYCKWGSNPSVLAIAVTATTITCVTPPMTGTQDLLIMYKSGTSPEREGSSPLSFTFYDCSTVGSTCDTCQSSTYPECGWCFRSADCRSRGACSNSGVNEWQNTTCPTISTIVPVPGTSNLDFGVEKVAAGTVAVQIQTQNWPTSLNGFSFTCAFTPNGETSTASYSNGLVTCPIPTGLSATPSSTEHFISLQTNGPTRPLVPSQTLNSFETYSCSGLQSCFTCNRHQGACTWCVGGSTSSCILNSTSCSVGTVPTPVCPSATSVTPTSLSLAKVPSSTVSFTGSGFAATSADLTQCYFDMGANHLTTPISPSLTDTQADCSFPGGITAGLWSVSLGSANYRQTAPFAINIYNCQAQATCSECLSNTFPDCDWCIDIAGGGCHDSSHSVPCSAEGWLSARGICPSLNETIPSKLPISGGTLQISGNHYLKPNNITQVNCYFEGAPLPGPTTSLASLNGTDIQCAAPSVLDVGTAQVSLVSAADSAKLYALPANFEYTSCSQLTTCEQCFEASNFCSWCGSTCTETNTCAASQIAAVCPTIISVEPTYSHMDGGELITITGTGFLTSMKRDFAKRSFGSYLSTTQKSRSVVENFGVQYGQVKRASGASPYSCDFGGIRVSADVDNSGTHIYCTTPAKAAIGSSILNVLYQGNLYLSTPGISYFTCDTTPSDVCDFSCTSYEHCGWCMSNSTCNSLSQCKVLSNSEDPIWQSVTCPTASLDFDVAPVKGGIPLVATVSEQFPASVATSDIACAFQGVGNTPADSVQVVQVTDAQGNVTSVSQVTCMVPRSLVGSIDTDFSVLWRGRKYVRPVTFDFRDCSANKDCNKCVSNPVCGWCSKGSKCTLSSECPETHWKKNKCPINKVAIGVGVGLGSFFFLLLLLLLLFLARRLRRKDGLLIALREPNYEEIAWGTDVALMWKVPSDNYQTLEGPLNRRDFLLQLAISFNCPATEQDALAKAMVYVAHAHGLAAEMIQTCIRYEVSTCLHENTLFRNNSVASKMYKFFSRIVGIKYLFNSIARVITELEVLGRQTVNAPRPTEDDSKRGTDVSLLSMTMELDQTKALGDDIDTETNLLQLQLICQKLLNVLIKTSLKDLPPAFRKIFIEIDNSIMVKFAGSNDAVYKGIGGLYFLRFVCPAITAPHVYGLLESPPNVVTQRQLVLISKVIQNVANMQPPGKKEEYMAALNDFIVQSIPKIIKFYDNLRQAINMEISKENEQSELTTPTEVRLNGLAAIWNFLHTDKQKIRNWAAPDECPLDHMQKDDLNTILTECEQAYPNAPKKIRSGDANAQPGSEKKKKKKSKN